MSSLLPLADLTPAKRLDLPDAPLCGRCGLWKTCLSPKMKPYGKGKLGVLVVGEAAGRNEDERGRPFIGDAGNCLRQELRSIGVDLDEDCWTVNSLSCRPPGNKEPTAKQIHYCRPLVQRAINEYQPNAILLLGAAAVSSVIGLAWGKGGLKGKDAKVGGVNRWLGYTIPSQVPNAWLVPTYSPLDIIEAHEKSREPPMEAFYWRKHLEGCFAITRKPWNGPPDYPSRCKSVMDERMAASYVRGMIGSNPIAWDIETDRLKPDHPKSSIICCSVSDGNTSIAFPWTNVTRAAMSELLTSPTPKWGWNSSFEEGWCLKEFGHGVTNWQLDGMLVAHVLDNKPGTKSLKFQAFARLGQPAYDDDVKPYFQADTGNTENRIRELTRSDGGWRKCLRYCAMDSLLEYELCSLMREELT